MQWIGVRRRLGRWRRRLAGATGGPRPAPPLARSGATDPRPDPTPSTPTRPAPAPSAPLAGPTLGRHRALLPRGTGRRVVLLAGDRRPEQLTALLHDFRADEVLICTSATVPDAGAWAEVTVRRTRTVADLHAACAETGPLDVLVDLLPDAGADADAFSTLFFHLRAGGVYALGQSAAGAPGVGVPPRAAAFLARHWQQGAPALVELDRAAVDPSTRIGESAPVAALRVEEELLAAFARVSVDRGWLLVSQRLPFVYKLAEDEVDRVLPLRRVGVEVQTVDRLPAGTLALAAPVTHHGNAAPIVNLPSSTSYPALAVRHYRGRTALAINQLLTAEATVLPASYRYPHQRHNPRVVAVGQDFGRIPARFRPTTTLAGDFYHLDGWNPGHFGHTMTEVVGRLWGFHQAKERFPDLRAVFRRRPPSEQEPTLELALFEAYGIDRSDVLWLDEPVWLESVVTATAMWENERPFFVHPELVAVWRRLRTALVAPRDDPPKRLFVSRRPGLVNRNCRNAAEVEQIFAAAGFAVIYPEELPFADQATLFGHAEVIAGFAGSALFNLIFAGRLQTLIVIGHEAYTARYEHLFTLALGCTTHYFWNPPDVPHPPGGWIREAYYSSWAFDLDRNGPPLRALLAGLPAP